MKKIKPPKGQSWTSLAQKSYDRGVAAMPCTSKGSPFKRRPAYIRRAFIEAIKYAVTHYERK